MQDLRGDTWGALRSKFYEVSFAEVQCGFCSRFG